MASALKMVAEGRGRFCHEFGSFQLTTGSQKIHGKSYSKRAVHLHGFFFKRVRAKRCFMWTMVTTLKLSSSKAKMIR
jgi:hypothetical protein